MNTNDLLNQYQLFKNLETSYLEKNSGSGSATKVMLELAEEEMKEAYKNLKLGIIDVLRHTNDFYKKIQQQNRELICNTSFEVKVIKVVKGPRQSDKFSTRFEGGIFPNGFLYYKSVETNQKYTLLSYASYLKGKIDEHGAGELKETDREVALIKTLPALYDAKISLDGSVNLKVTELDPSLEQRLIAYHLAGDPFNRSEKRRKLFLRNRTEMNRLIGLQLDELAKLNKR